MLNCRVIISDRTSAEHGGVCFFSRVCIKIKHLPQFESPNLEVLWMQLRPSRLQRGIVAATIYHPMLEYLSKSLTDIERFLPGCGIVIVGDFNHLNIKNLSRQLQLNVYFII